VCGFEINPYAAAVCEFKLSLSSVPVHALSHALQEFGTAVERAIAGGDEPKSERPPGFTTRERFLAEAVERKVLLALDFIKALDEPLVRRCFEVALASELVGFSNYSYEPSLGTRTAAGKPKVEDAPVARKVARKVAQMIEDIEAVQQKLVREGLRPKVEFRAGDFFKEDQAVPDASVDLVVTSPPYLNNYHYIRNSRPQAYWLGLVASPEDMRRVEEGSFGKFWQTVRGGPEVRLAFAMPDLEEAVAFLRGRNAEKGAYGGPGWANYAATYFNDCRRFARMLRRVLKPGGRAVVVLGNSILQGVEFRTDEIFGRICEQAGLAVEQIQPLRTKRTGASIIRSSVRVNAAQEKTTLYESAVVVAGRPRARTSARRGTEVLRYRPQDLL
jgi:methylase of polypeptide subunit release factors